MKKKKIKYLRGGEEVKARIRWILPKIGNPITERHVRRLWEEKKLPHEPKENPLDPFEMAVNSVPYIDPDCDLAGFKQLADFTGYGESYCRKRVKQGYWPADRLWGRLYFVSNSFETYRKKLDNPSITL